MLNPCRIGRKAWIIGQQFAIARFHKVSKLTIVTNGYDDPTIRGLEGLIGHHIRMRIAPPMG